MLRMASMLRGDAASSGGAPDPFASLGLGGLGGAANSFPAPGTPGSTANSTATSTTTPASGPNANAAQDPFGLFSALGAGGAAGGAAGAGGLPAFDPALMQQLMYGGGGAFGNPMNAFGLGGAAGATPGAVGAAGAGAAVTQSPEERFQVQLQVRIVCCFFRLLLVAFCLFLPLLLSSPCRRIPFWIFFITFAITRRFYFLPVFFYPSSRHSSASTFSGEVHGRWGNSHGCTTLLLFFRI